VSQRMAARDTEWRALARGDVRIDACDINLKVYIFFNLFGALNAPHRSFDPGRLNGRLHEPPPFCCIVLLSILTIHSPIY
jgi:hypothetical protein